MEPVPKQEKSEEKQTPRKAYVLETNAKGRKVYTFRNFEEFPFEVDEEYELDTIKGWGTYSTVCSGTNTTTGQLVAIKRVHKVFEDLGDTRRILREIKILSTVSLT